MSESAASNSAASRLLQLHVLPLRDWLILFFVSLFLFAPGISSLPPTDRDESRYVVTSQRMADTGDMVDLRYQDRPRYLQPAGIYWLQSTAARIFDSPAHDSIWAYRLPSLLGAIGAVLLTGWLGATFFGRNVGISAALLLAACFSLNYEARNAKIDATLLAVITLAQVALMRAYVQPATNVLNKGRLNAAMFWAALGAGLMLKGPIILIVAFSTIAALVAWDRKAAWLKKLHAGWGVLLMLAIALPWFIAINTQTNNAFFERAVMRNFLGKVNAGEQGHSGPAGYHIALFMLVFWPGALLAFRALGFAWRERTTPAIRFLICWILPTWIIFEFVATKLPHYVLPTYPAVALIAAGGLFSLKPAPEHKWRTWVFIAASALWLVVSAVVAALAPGVYWHFHGGLNVIAALIGVLAFAAAAAALYFLWRGEKLKVIAAMVLSAFLAWSNAFAFVLPKLDEFWMSPRIAEAARKAAPCPDSVLVSIPYTEPSMVFLYGRDKTHIVATTGAEAADVMAKASACGMALIGAEEKPAFMIRAGELGLSPQAVESIRGQNYSNGDKLDLTLYVAGPPVSAAPK